MLEIAGGAIAPGADVNLSCCGFNTVSFVAGSASATGNIDVDFGERRITGNVPAGISIDIENGGILRSLTDYTNAGTITLKGDGAEIRTANGTTGTTETLTNLGTGTIAYAGTGGTEYIGGDLLNQGTISVAHPDATFQPRGENRKPRLTNAATVTVASGGDLETVNAFLRQASGGTINGPGPVNVSSAGPFSNFSVLEIAGGAIAPGADVNLVCCGFNTVSFVGGSATATGNIDVQAGDHPIIGNVPAGISLDVESGGRLGSQTDFTNYGTITLLGADAEIRTANGNNADIETLTNRGTIAYAGTGGSEYIGGDLLNFGTISVAHPDATFAPRGETRKPRWTNRGTVAVAGGGVLEILNAILRQGSGGTINGPGPVNVTSEGPFSNFSVLEIGGGAIAPSADVNLSCCGFNTVSFIAGCRERDRQHRRPVRTAPDHRQRAGRDLDRHRGRRAAGGAGRLHQRRHDHPDRRRRRDPDRERQQRRHRDADQHGHDRLHRRQRRRDTSPAICSTRARSRSVTPARASSRGRRAVRPSSPTRRAERSPSPRATS